MKVKILEKGYTLRITSWENDGDNYRTEIFQTQDKATAEEVKRFCDRFLSKPSEGGYGNALDLTKEDEKHIRHDLKKFPLLFPPEEYAEDSKGQRKLIWHAIDFAQELTGPSEFYTFRVVEDCEILYSEEEVFAQKVVL
jgi:hypothetical protein